jgi:2,3-bisphosphoglycerate-dependent phosphoglycerate mutase
MPSELILIRHGESEGCEANRLSRSGDDSKFTEEFLQRPQSSWKLTPKGIKQAKAAGKWLRDWLPPDFATCLSSDYQRAKETALEIIPKANWHFLSGLRERSWGEIAVMPHRDRWERFPEVMAGKVSFPFYWRPPGGESMLDVCDRASLILHVINKCFPSGKVLLVSHAEMMIAFRTILEKWTIAKFERRAKAGLKRDSIGHCAILHYRAGKSGQINSFRLIPNLEPSPKYDWRYF